MARVTADPGHRPDPPDATDLGYLKNSAVLAVDQDAIDASRIVNSGNQQVYSKTESERQRAHRPVQLQR